MASLRTLTSHPNKKRTTTCIVVRLDPLKSEPNPTQLLIFQEAL